MIKVLLPQLGEGIEKASVSYWFVKVGDHVNKGDDFVECATDKATFNVPASASGVLHEIVVQEGDTVAVGEVLAEIEPDG